MQERPELCTDEHLRFLDQLRAGGSVNMFGAAQVLRESYPELDRGTARKVHAYWMKSFGRENR